MTQEMQRAVSNPHINYEVRSRIRKILGVKESYSHTVKEKL
jgi:hypothetical protein